MSGKTTTSSGSTHRSANVLIAWVIPEVTTGMLNVLVFKVGFFFSIRSRQAFRKV